MKTIAVVVLVGGCAIADPGAVRFEVGPDVRPEQVRAAEDAAQSWGLEVGPHGRPVMLRSLTELDPDDEALARASWRDDPQQIWVNTTGYLDFPYRAWRETMLHEVGHLLARCDGHLPQGVGIMSSPHEGREITQEDADFVWSGCAGF